MSTDRVILESVSVRRRSAWTAVLGITVLTLFGTFFLLPQVRAAFPDGGGSATFARFQLASSAGALRDIFGEPANPAVVAAVNAVNRLDLFVFIPIYGAFLIASALMLGVDRSRALSRIILASTIVGVLGDILETTTQLRITGDLANAGSLLSVLAIGTWTKNFGLAVAALGCSVVCLRFRPRHWGPAIGGLSPLPLTIAACFDADRFGPQLSNSLGGFWIGLLIFAVQHALSRKARLSTTSVARTSAAGLIAVLVATPAFAQELEPRAFGIAPVGTTIVLTSVGGSKGGILFDPSINVSDVNADLKTFTTGAGYTFALAGRQSRILVIFPYASGHITGDVGGQPQRQSLHGLADPRIRFSVGLRGAPARSAGEIARAPKRMAMGLAVTLMAPWGQYDPSQVANLGYNRWGIKPELGITKPIGRFTFENSLGVWFFTDNTWYGAAGARKEQDALLSLQSHTIYALTRRVWLAFDSTWFAGGQTRIAGIINPDEQRNTRMGATLSIPIARSQSLKFVYSSGTKTRRGTDFDSLNVTWQLVRF